MNGMELVLAEVDDIRVEVDKQDPTIKGKGKLSSPSAIHLASALSEVQEVPFQNSGLLTPEVLDVARVSPVKNPQRRKLAGRSTKMTGLHQSKPR